MAEKRATSPIPRALLKWYDKNARQLPWRVSPGSQKRGQTPDPYRVWLSEVMLQQTTVATVLGRYDAFMARWPTVEDLAAAPIEDVLGEWAGLGYYARARNLHKCAIAVASRGGFPEDEAQLKSLPGIGDYTAAAIAAIAYDAPAVVVDGNIERVVSRLFAIEEALPAAKIAIKERASEIWPAKRSGDFAQALMDLGAQICRPRAPQCLICPLSANCVARKRGDAERFPIKAKKKPKPARTGAVFVLMNAAGEVLFERRPAKGLLGGMLGLPGTEWSEGGVKNALADAPSDAAWRHAGEARHVFTHFILTLDVYAAVLTGASGPMPEGEWAIPDTAKLPTVMQKALHVGLA